MRVQLKIVLYYQLHLILQYVLPQKYGGPLFHGDHLEQHACVHIGGKLLRLRAHVLDLGKLERAVLLRFAQRFAGNVGVDVDLEGLVVFADDERIADAVQKSAERLDAAPALADDEDRT